jgi:hypothetical protein
MSEDPAALALELDEARARHVRLLTSLSQRIRQLDEKWRAARATDRLLAVQRLVQSGALDKSVAGDLENKNETVRALLSRARVDRKKVEQNPDNFDLKHALFKLELDLQAAENERDELIDEKDLRGPLYFVGETFVREIAFGGEEMPLKDIAAHISALEPKIAELSKRVDRKGVRFTATASDGKERTLIRMLPALTVSGEGEAQ